MKLKNKFMYILTILIAFMFMYNIEAEMPEVFRTVDTSGGQHLEVDQVTSSIEVYHQKAAKYCNNGSDCRLDSSWIVGEFDEFCLNDGKKWTSNKDYYSLTKFDSGNKHIYTNEGYACALVEYWNGLDSASATEFAKSISETKGGAVSVGDKYESIQMNLWSKSANSICSVVPKKNAGTSKNYANPTITLDNENWKLSSDSKYYVSSKIKVSNYTSSYKVSLSGAPTGTKISSSSNTLTEVSGTGKTDLYLFVPTSQINNIGSTTLTVTTSYSETTFTASVYEYAAVRTNCTGTNIGNYKICTPNDGYQILALISGKESTSTKSLQASLTFKSPTGGFKIKKINNAKNDVAVEGAKFKLCDDKECKKTSTYADGTEILELVTSSDGTFTVNNLRYGTYYLIEVEAAPGYELPEKQNVIEITVNNNSLNSTKTVTNKPVMTKISKKAISGEEELKGAHIIIFDEENNIVDEFDSTDEIHEIYLGPGKYKLKETISPEGYQALDTIFNFEIKNNGNVVLLDVESEYFKTNKNEITIYNKPVEIEVPDTGKVSIIFSVIGLILVVVGAAIIYMKRIKVNNSI